MSVATINYYHVLGVSETATTSDIKSRYRSLCKQYHPDLNSGNEAKMAQINEAYAVLSDPIKRHYYEPPKPKTDTNTHTVTTATRPVYNTPYKSTPFQHATTAHKNTSRQHHIQKDESWSKLFTYSVSALFIAILAIFTVPAANRFLADYQSKAASAADTNSAASTSHPSDQNETSNNPPNQSQTNDSTQDSNTYYNPDSSSSTGNGQTYSDNSSSQDTATDNIEEDTQTTTQTNNTDISQQQTNNQPNSNRWYTRHNYRSNN